MADTRGYERHPETLWKLVEARCDQLRDSISMARIPFLLALTWSFFWAWQLYGDYLGYSQTYRDRYVHFRLATMRLDRKPFNDDDIAEFRRICGRLSPEQLAFAKPKGWTLKDWDDQTELCKEILTIRFQWSQKAWLDARVVQFPGGFGSIQTSDLGVVGQAGLILILLWGFFAIRRENHSIKAFVDYDFKTRRIGKVRPRKFTLVPQDRHLSSEHYAFAYHSVSERFVFLFSHYSRPVLLTTIMLFFVPGLVAAAGLIGDLNYFYATPPELIEREIYIRVGCEMPLLAVVIMVTWLQIRLTLETSSLLNGWYLAANDVWMEKWDERHSDPAPNVEIDVETQTATELKHPAETEAQATR